MSPLRLSTMTQTNLPSLDTQPDVKRLAHHGPDNLLITGQVGRQLLELRLAFLGLVIFALSPQGHDQRMQHFAIIGCQGDGSPQPGFGAAQVIVGQRQPAALRQRRRIIRMLSQQSVQNVAHLVAVVELFVTEGQPSAAAGSDGRR